jgi:hypothetical protein
MVRNQVIQIPQYSLLILQPLANQTAAVLASAAPVAEAVHVQQKLQQEERTPATVVVCVAIAAVPVGLKPVVLKQYAQLATAKANVNHATEQENVRPVMAQANNNVQSIHMKIT